MAVETGMMLTWIAWVGRWTARRGPLLVTSDLHLDFPSPGDSPSPYPPPSLPLYYSTELRLQGTNPSTTCWGPVILYYSFLYLVSVPFVNVV